jgi:carboxypeptidase PM20D1
MLRRIALLLLTTVVVIVAIAAIRTWRIISRQPEPAAATAPPAPTVDLAAALAEAIQYQTISYDEAPPDPEEQARAFDGLHAFLRATFPRTMVLAERIDGQSLLISLGPPPSVTIDGAVPNRGANTGTAPAAGRALRAGALVYAHLDVVPATADGWTADPFSGTLAGDAVVGRGALDDKGSVIAILAATESLLASGWTPARPMYLAFGDNEEAGGSSAAAIAGACAIRASNSNRSSTKAARSSTRAFPDYRAGRSRPSRLPRKGVMNVEICALSAPDTPARRRRPPPSARSARRSRDSKNSRRPGASTRSCVRPSRTRLQK